MTIFVDLVEQIDVELSVLVVVLYVGGQLVSTGVMWVVLVQLVTFGMVVCGQDFFCVHCVKVV